MSNPFKLVFSLAIPNAVGILAGLITMPAIGNWYLTITKPSWTPPDWVFAPVWTILYTLMGIAVYLVWRDYTGQPDVRKGLIWFDVQLALNFLWSAVFFGLKSPGLAFVVIIGLWVAIVVTMGIFWELKKKTAVLLLVPYILWVSYALALNAQIWFMN
ncbi:tryptophan-rich sensory protein [Candidatus Uhrbacteria bacterium]|nr:tryptophan-rich sensory protein [Candidatus Uhrbacteria bacterium]